MRRFVNFCLMLVVLGAVGYLLYKAKLLPDLPVRQSAPTPTATNPARSSLRVGISHRPEALLLSALKRLLKAEGHEIEVVEFSSQTSWMELAAGELDVVVAPLGEAVTAQARYDVGRFLFLSGQSQGYDVIMASESSSAPPQTLGISGGDGGELFAISKFPNARLLSAANQRELQLWLREGAIEAALLESATLGSATPLGKPLSATSTEQPVPTVLVLSRALTVETPETAERLAVLRKSLEFWEQLIDYLASQPELLGSILRPEAEEMGIDLDVLFKDYRFLVPSSGRQALLNALENGSLKQTFDLLVLARTLNMTTPAWDEVLTLPDHLQSAFPNANPPLPASSATPVSGPSPASPVPTATPSPAVSPTASASPTTSALGTHRFVGKAPPDPWPEPMAVTTVAQPLDFPAALTGDSVAVATSSGLSVISSDGKPQFEHSEGGAPVAAPVAEAGVFYFVQSGLLSALDTQGALLWSYPLEGKASSAVALTASDVVVSLSDAAGHHLLAVSRQTGALTWQAPLTAPTLFGPLFTSAPGPTVFVLDETGVLQAYHAQTGSRLWQTDSGVAASLAPAVYGEALALLDSSGAVRLFSVVDGSKIWESNLGTPLAASPTVTDTLVLVPARDSYLYALSRKDGSIQHKAHLSVPLSSPAFVVGDHVYCSDEQGGVHSLKLPALSLQWSKSLAKGAVLGPVFSDRFWSLLGADGRLAIYAR